MPRFQVRKYILWILLREHKHLSIRPDSDLLDRDPAQPEWMGSLVRRQVLPFVGIVGDVAGITVRRTSRKRHRTVPSLVNVTGHEQEVSVRTPALRACRQVHSLWRSLGWRRPYPHRRQFAHSLEYFVRLPHSAAALTIAFIRPLALRVEGDYLRTQFFSTAQNNFRLSWALSSASKRAHQSRMQKQDSAGWLNPVFCGHDKTR